MQRPNDHLSGYGCYKCNAQKQYSNKQIEWLNFLSLYYNINIQHAENEGEYKIPETNYKADGYCKETKIQFLSMMVIFFMEIQKFMMKMIIINYAKKHLVNYI